MIKRYPESIKHLSRSFQIMIFIFVRRLDSGKNCLVALVGATGSGKSFAGVCILYWCYVYMYGEPPTLEYMKQHWFFTAKDFLNRMNNPDLTKRELNLWDEMGTSASHKDHQTLQNKAISWLVQTFRNLEQMVIFTVPSLAYVDKSVRNLLHFQLETRTILMSKKKCIIKPLELQYNIRMDKMFYHNFMYPSKDEKGMMDEVDVTGIPLPPKEFVKAYEELSWEFKAELNKKIQGMLERAEAKDNFKNLQGEDLILSKCTPNQKMVMDYWKRGITKTGEIARSEGVNDSNISNYIWALKNKGLNIEKMRENGRNSPLLYENTADTI